MCACSRESSELLQLFRAEVAIRHHGVIGVSEHCRGAGQFQIGDEIRALEIKGSLNFAGRARGAGNGERKQLLPRLVGVVLTKDGGDAGALRKPSQSCASLATLAVLLPNKNCTVGIGLSVVNAPPRAIGPPLSASAAARKFPFNGMLAICPLSDTYTLRPP